MLLPIPVRALGSHLLPGGGVLLSHESRHHGSQGPQLLCRPQAQTKVSRVGCGWQQSDRQNDMIQDDTGNGMICPLMHIIMSSDSIWYCI